jgi:signal transduction histidine kinase
MSSARFEDIGAITKLVGGGAANWPDFLAAHADLIGGLQIRHPRGRRKSMAGGRRMSNAPIDFGMVASGGAPAREYRAGDVIFRYGDVGRELFIIQSGKVEIIHNDRVLETLSDFDIFGEMALIDSAPRSATAVAVTDARLVPVSEDQFLCLISSAPQFVINIMRVLTRRLRERELRNELMNVDAIIGSIGHEIRQPLAAIVTNANAAMRFLEREQPDYDEVRAALQRISSDGLRTSEVFDSIRALFKKIDSDRGPVDLNSIAAEVLQSLRAELSEKHVTVNSQVASGLPLVEGNRGQLYQVIFNLVRNAIEAMDTVNFSSRKLLLSTQRSGRDAVALGVQDSGPGVDARQLDRIFDAFVTTKANGMGLGLAICRTIVLRHSGQLTVSSDGKSGAFFQLVLPASSAAKTFVRAE